MPMQSQQQRKAMYAAKGGTSTIGIPQGVGAKFVAHDEGSKLPNFAAGTARSAKRKAMAGTKAPKPSVEGY